MCIHTDEIDCQTPILHKKRILVLAPFCENTSSKTIANQSSIKQEVMQTVQKLYVKTSDILVLAGSEIPYLWAIDAVLALHKDEHLPVIEWRFPRPGLVYSEDKASRKQFDRISKYVHTFKTYIYSGTTPSMLSYYKKSAAEADEIIFLNNGKNSTNKLRAYIEELGKKVYVIDLFNKK